MADEYRAAGRRSRRKHSENLLPGALRFRKRNKCLQGPKNTKPLPGVLIASAPVNWYLATRTLFTRSGANAVFANFLRPAVSSHLFKNEQICNPIRENVDKQFDKHISHGNIAPNAPKREDKASPIFGRGGAGMSR